MVNAIDSYELSPLQQGMLFHAVSAQHSGVDIEQIVIRLREPMQMPAFTAAWRALLQRHTILRTRFRWEDRPEPVQEVVATAELPLTHEDWRELSPDECEARFANWLAADRRHDFDLATPPLLRLFFAQLPDELRIVWTFHHALLDGRSFQPLLRELFAHYEAALQGEPLSMPEPVAYREYIEWRRALDLGAAEAYWRQALRGFSVPTPLALDIPAATAGTQPSFGAVQCRLSTEFTAQLRTAAQGTGVTLNTLLQAAWALLLHRYSGESEVVFGATRSGRGRELAGAEDRVGLFINTLPVRVRVDGNMEVAAWLQALRAEQSAARAFEHAPLNAVQSWSEVPRGTALFDSVVVYDHRSLDAQMRALGGAWCNRHCEYIGQTNFPLALIAYGDDAMLLRLEYSRQRISAAAAERMLGHLSTLLAELSRGSSRLKDLALLTDLERADLLARAGGTRSHARGPALHHRFEAQVARTPEAIALTAWTSDGKREELSYTELNRRADALAHYLHASGVQPNQLVGLRTERNTHLVVGLLAILKAGAAYLPLDPVYPPERIAFMLEDAGVAIVLTQTSLRSSLGSLPVTLACIDEFVSADGSRGPVSAPYSPDDLAYVIYTSGSTGKPKGVRISHHNVARLFAATDAWFGFDADDVWTLFHSYAFDFSVWELWGALLYGGRVVVVPHDVSRNTESFRELLVAERVTVLNQTPTAFRQLVDTDRALPAAKLALRYVVFGGEALELQSLRPWFERYGDRQPRLVNMYGITETTVHVTYRALSLADLAANAGSVIGEPIPDLSVHLLDAEGRLVPTGVPGEMYVAGAGVAHGYLNRPELTAQRFVPDRFGTTPGALMYRSGDLARRLDNGDLEYLGRIDQQVKIRGFRIELGEIEAVIARHPGVRQVAVIDREDVPGHKRLVAYLVVARENAALAEELRTSLRQVLPDYMVPAHFVVVDALRLTPNGKLDRRALPAPRSAQADRSKPRVAPRNAVEQIIAQVWQSVLRIDEVGIDDPFFDLGGDSILSIQVIARCRQQGLRLTPKDLFKRPTIAQLAEVATLTSAASSTATAGQAEGEVPLIPIQRWFFAQQFTHAHHWNQSFMFTVPAGFDTAVLRSAVQEVVRQHDALRLRYSQQGSEWQQHYVAGADAEVQVVDLAHLEPAAQAAAITEHSTRAQSRFDLATGPLMCAVHFQCGSDRSGRLLLAIHHLAVDGVSWRVLLEDLETACTALAARATPQFPGKTSSLQAWSRQLDAYAQTPAVSRTAEFWHSVSQAPAAELPHDTPPASVPGQVTLLLSAEETHSLLQEVPAALRTQINDVLLSALSLALQCGGGPSMSAGPFRIDLEGHGREHIAEDLDVSRTVGWFTTLFPVALEPAPTGDVLDTLLAVRDQLRRIPHRGLSYGLLRFASRDTTLRAALETTQPASIVFNYLGQFDSVVAHSKLFAFAEESTGPWRSPQARRTHAHEILSWVRNGRLEIAWHYAAGTCSEATVRRTVESMVAALQNIVALARTAPTVPYTPGDFPLARLDRPALQRLLERCTQVQDIYPLTPMQRLFFAMEAAASNLGFEQWHFRVEGRMQPALLRQAIEQVIARHSILRSAFLADGGAEPLQVVCEAPALPWSEEDWRAFDTADRQRRLDELLRADAKAGFDLARPPLMRVALRRVADDTWHLVWSTHHLCIDGWSWPLVFRDVSRSYAALEAGREPGLEPAIGYRDYVEWLNESAPQSEDFWRSELRGFTAPTPFRLRAAPAASDEQRAEQPHFAEVEVSIPAPVTAELQNLARREQVTLSVLVNAAWSLLLAHYSGQAAVVFGAAFSGRPGELPGIENMVGPCVNNLPISVAVAPEAALGSLLAALHQRQFEIAQHQYAPLERIQQWAGVPWRHRLFDSLVVFQNYQIDAEARSIGAAAHTVLLAAPESTNYALTLTVTVRDGLHIRLIYSPRTLDAADVGQFGADLTAVLHAMANPTPLTLAAILSKLSADSRGKATALLAASKPAPDRGFAAPASDAERLIAGLWTELFGIERISLDANFFELGGHSLLLVRAHAALKQRLDRDLPIVALLQYPTVRSLARHLTAGPQAATTAQPTMDRAQKQRLAQQRQRTLTRR